MSTPRPSEAMARSAVRNWMPQSHRTEPRASPVRHSEWRRVRTPRPSPRSPRMSTRCNDPDGQANARTSNSPSAVGSSTRTTSRATSPAPRTTLPDSARCAFPPLKWGPPGLGAGGPRPAGDYTRLISQGEGGAGVRLVLDWDGTVTERDTLELVLDRFGDIATYRRTGMLMGRGLSHDEALAQSFRTVRAPLDVVVRWVVGSVRVREGFRELVERYRPLVVSSGFRELIDPVLVREGVELEVLANRVDARADGWRITFRERSRCATCGEPCKRSVLPAGEVAYVGDGYSDRCAALAAARVFATDGLARYLDERGIPYERFDDLRDVTLA